MTETEIKNWVIEQLKIDYQVLDSYMENDSNLFIYREKKKDDKRKIIKLSSFISILCLGDKVIFCGDSRIIDWCREQYSDYPAQWFSNFDNLKFLNDKLAENNYKINPYSHHYYVPSCLCNLKEVKYETRDINGEEISKLTQKEIFKNALFQNAFREEQIGIACYDNDKMIALIVATKRSNIIWEISVDTRLEYRNKGIASALIKRMTNNLLESGKIPIYGTSESNINSQKLAIKADYKPLWYELYSQKM